MTPSGPPRLLILETSGRAGLVALAEGPRILGSRRLDEARRHARDLTPAVAALLQAQGWRPRDVQVVLVSIGPGSYTGLRVGIMAAKVYAYATGATLIGVDTFQAIAGQADAAADPVDVLADAQQDLVYVQRFTRDSATGAAVPAGPLAIRPVADWLAERGDRAWVTGPGLRRIAERIPGGARIVDAARWDPTPEGLLAVGLARYGRGERDDPWKLEPLYLRPSSAEETWDARRRPPANESRT